MSQAAQSHTDARTERGIHLLFGIDCPPDPAAGLACLLDAEAHGSTATADYALALIAIGDVLLPRDPARIEAWLRRAAAQGFSPALRTAALLFARHPDAQSQCDAVWCLRQASAQDDAIAAALLAHRLATGHGVAVDPAASLHMQALARRVGIGLDRSEASSPTTAAPPLAALHEPDWARLTLPTFTGNRTDARMLCAQPAIRVVDAVLSREECRLVRYCGTPHLRRSRVVDPRSGQPLCASLRTNRDANLVPALEDISLRLIQLRFATIAGNPPLSHFEPLVVLHYAPGEQYRPHRDYLPASDPTVHGPGGQRAITVCCYLNEGMQGGATAFPDVGIRVEPRLGSAVVFANLDAQGRPDPASLHAGEPVRFGEKWLATSWIRQGPIRTF